MKLRTPLLLLAASSLLLIASVARAQLTVVTDKTQYSIGEVVHITIHNAGPGEATFFSDPAYSIWHSESGDCVDGCSGLPVVWTLPAGGTINVDRNTGAEPDLVGHYEIGLAGSSPDPGSILGAEYVLLPPVSTTVAPWGTLKGWYR